MRVVVTGANRGIGFGLVSAYVKRGEEVHATARRPEAADALQKLKADSRGRLHVHRLDVTSEEDCASLARVLAGDSVDILVNNAGVGGGWKTLADEDMQSVLRTIEVNAVGPLRVTRALVDNVKAARGKIVNVSSLMGSIADNGSGRVYGYRMSKAALNMATKNLAVELAPANVTVIAVNPGWVKTDMGGADAPTPVAECVSNMVALLDRVTTADSGKFLGTKGQEAPW